MSIAKIDDLLTTESVETEIANKINEIVDWINKQEEPDSTRLRQSIEDTLGKPT